MEDEQSTPAESSAIAEEAMRGHPAVVIGILLVVLAALVAYFAHYLLQR